MSQRNKRQQAYKSASVNRIEPTPEQQLNRKPVRTTPTSTIPSTNQNEPFLKIPSPNHEKASIPMTKTYEEFTSINKEAVDAFVKSSAIFAKGFEEISRQVFALTQTLFEANMATGKAVMGVKTPKDLLDLQSGLVSHSFNTALSQATKISELSVKIANQAAEPIQAHFSNALGKMGNGADRSKAA